jgi:membrane-associated protein
VSALSDLAALLLQLLPSYGYEVLSAATFAGAAGVPLPTTLLLLAAGALASEGILDYLPAVLVVLATAVAGDCLLYWLGRAAGRALVEHHGRRVGLSAPRVAAADRAFGRWGGGAVWLSRWLLTAAGPVVSLLAGTNRYRFASFVVFAGTGEAIWAGGYIGLGWLFGDNWEALVDLVDNAVWVLASLALAAVVGLVAWRRLRAPAGATEGPSG